MFFSKLKSEILGPLFFSIYTSQLLTHISNCNIHLYADDTQLYYSFPPQVINDACNVVNNDLDTFVSAAKDHCLVINSSKSKVLLFGSKLNCQRISNNVNIIVNDAKLEVVANAKNLGVIMDTELRFEKHINTVLQKAYSSLKMIYGIRHFLPFHVKKLLCETLILSLFNYADVLYGPCLAQKYKFKIQKIQNCCLRLIFGIQRRRRIAHKLKEIGWLNMERRRTLHSACLYHRIIFSRKPPYLHRKITFRTDIHNLNIRNRGLLTVPQFKLELFRRSFRYQICSVYNGLPQIIKDKTFSGFKKSLREFLFRNQV